MDSITWLNVKAALRSLWDASGEMTPEAFELAFRNSGLQVGPITEGEPSRSFEAIAREAAALAKEEEAADKAFMAGIAWAQHALEDADEVVIVRESIDGEAFKAIPVDDIDSIIGASLEE